MLLAALAVALTAFGLYHATLLPGVDLGDGGSFQTMVGSPFITPRNGYPLYFAIGAAMLRLTGAAPAYALNLTSAIEAAIACGLFVVVAMNLTGSLTASVAGALLFAVSYTFWSQAVTAEVYALHIALVLATLLFLLRWEERRTPGRLAAFFACYALAFGNHLSTILLAPGLTCFLLVTAGRQWRTLVTPRVLGLAVVIACAGALQYAWNLRTLWYAPHPPDTIWEALRIFWFDVTKADWRETLVAQVPESMRTDHAWMYWFDLRQQFGLPGVLLSLLGVAGLTIRRPRYGLLLFLLFAANFVFAFGYNVGDAHVFYLPSHLVVALFAAAGIASVLSIRRVHRGLGVAAAILVVAYVAARGYRDFPALDRSGDRRAAAMLGALTEGLDDQRAILLVDLNWQVANGLSYFTRASRPEVATARMRDVLLYAPALVDDNVASGRLVALTDHARAILVESYGPLFDVEPDFDPPAMGELSDAVRLVPRGTRYALCVLKPTRDFAIDRRDLEAAVRLLSPSANVVLPEQDYVVVAGVAGEPPTLVVGSNTPFTQRTSIGDVPVEVRMESWLSFDTIRRMGFGHIVAAHRHTLIVERGVSFATFGPDGVALSTNYVAGIFARPHRYLIRKRVLR